jgi:hypothetical protein
LKCCTHPASQDELDEDELELNDEQDELELDENAESQELEEEQLERELEQEEEDEVRTISTSISEI